MRPTLERTPHLVALVATAERLATLLRRADPDPATTEDLVERAVLASLRLDGSPMVAQPAGVAAGPRGTWLDSMGLTGEPDDAVVALEYAGLQAGLIADDLAQRILVEPEAALGELHRRLTRGLVGEGVAARARRTRQAVHDASVGRIIFHAVAPEQVPARLAALGGWLVSAGTREHALIVSGVAHHELLAIHPYEAANGRLARTAARLVLRARGLDPHRIAPIEELLAEDPLGYYGEVARTLHRRDLTIWLERWGEAVTGGLRAAAHHLDLLAVAAPGRVHEFLAGWDEPRFTVTDYRAQATVGPERSRADLELALDAGLIRRVPGGRGLRFAVGAMVDADRGGRDLDGADADSAGDAAGRGPASDGGA